MDFGEITEVVPWDILAKDCEQNLDANQQCEPRLFKSHEPWVRENGEEGKKTYKTVYTRRHKTPPFSFFVFLPGWMVTKFKENQTSKQTRRSDWPNWRGPSSQDTVAKGGRYVCVVRASGRVLQLL